MPLRNEEEELGKEIGGESFFMVRITSNPDSSVTLGRSRALYISVTLTTPGGKLVSDTSRNFQNFFQVSSSVALSLSLAALLTLLLPYPQHITANPSSTYVEAQRVCVVASLHHSSLLVAEVKVVSMLAEKQGKHNCTLCFACLSHTAVRRGDM